MIKDYVVKIEKLSFDGVDFVKDDILGLDSETQEFSSLLADGSIEEAPQDELPEKDEDSIDIVEPKEKLFDGKKIVGEVLDAVVEDVKYKTFSTEDGSSYKVTEEEFNMKVL